MLFDLIDLAALRQLALGIIGAGVAVHMLFTLNFMPPCTSCALWAPAAAAVASGVYTVHQCIVGHHEQAMNGTAASAAALLIFQLVLWARGYTVSDFLHRSDGPGK